MIFLRFLNPTLQFYKVVPFGLFGKSDTELTNETNERIARETNATNVSMNEANNATQIRLQQEMNEYNSLEQQLERAKEAGVNPNAIISGSVNGNLQTSIPQTQAGHADSWRVENPYMEKLQTIQTLQNTMDSFIRNLAGIEQADLTHAQAQGQYLENEHIDDLRNLSKVIGRAQAKKLDEEVKNLGQQRDLMVKQGEEIKASIANMDEKTRQIFIDNQFREESKSSFVKYCREMFDKQNIPRSSQLSDDALTGIYFGALSRYNLPMSQLQTEAVKRASDRAGIGVQNAMRNLYNAQTRGQYIQNAYDSMFGWSERAGNIQEQDSRVNLNNANASKARQNYNIDNWQTSPEVQTQRALQVRLDNLQTDANIDNTKADTAKKGAETVESVTRSANNLIDTFTPWAP